MHSNFQVSRSNTFTPLYKQNPCEHHRLIGVHSFVASFCDVPLGGKALAVCRTKRCSPVLSCLSHSPSQGKIDIRDQVIHMGLNVASQAQCRVARIHGISGKMSPVPSCPVCPPMNIKMVISQLLMFASCERSLKALSGCYKW